MGPILGVMAWRIDEQVIRGEIDNRVRGRVAGRIWLVGREDPLVLELEGNPWRDLAGHMLRFTNPSPKPSDLAGLTEAQFGVVGDVTASRKVKVLECTTEEFEEICRAHQPFPWHWGNSLYLEWFSQSNGRVVIESTAYQLELEPTAAWEMSAADEIAQREANGAALVGFMNRLVGGADIPLPEFDEDDDDDDAPQSRTEAEADAEDEWMETLLDRVTARLEREGLDGEEFDRLYTEERARLQRERGIVEPEPTPEQEEERAAWIDELNAVTAAALEDAAADDWKGGDGRPEHHPLCERCSELAVSLHHQIKANGWLAEAHSAEHPIREIADGVMIASAKLAGALGGHLDDEWPPDPLIAGNTLVRLKKARRHLRDSIRGLDSADEENLATPAWRTRVRAEVTQILTAVEELIREVRAILAETDEED